MYETIQEGGNCSFINEDIVNANWKQFKHQQLLSKVGRLESLIQGHQGILVKKRIMVKSVK